MMTKKEFVCGICIISLIIIGYIVIDKSSINTTKEVKITQVYSIETKTDEDGNVQVEVK